MKQKNKLRYDNISTYFKMNKKLVIILCVTDFLFNALMCLIPLMQGRAIDAFSDGVPFTRLIEAVAAFIGLVLFVQVNRYIKRFLGRSFGNRMALTMRTVSYKNLVHSDMSYFATASKGDILNKMLTDIWDASDGITKMTTECFDTIVLLIGYLITMFYMDVQITLIVMVFILISIISSKAFKRLIYKYTIEYKEYLSYTKDMTLTCLKNELYYRGFGVNKTYRQLYEESQDVLEKKSLKSMILQSCLEPVYSILTWMGLFFIVWIGGRRVLDQSLTIGVFSAFLSTYMLVAAKASRIGRVFGWYQNLRVAWVRCKPYLTEKKEMREEFDENRDDPGMGTLKADNFSFGFDDNFHLPVMDFEARKGEMIGVCGIVHTGKSTLLAALSGLYPYEGKLSLSGYEVNKTCCPVGYCSAGNFIFEDTLLQNITMGRAGDFLKAMEDSGLMQDIELFEEKEQQQLSHSQVNLSGGQQKRLMLARAIFNQPPLILLDDPFQSIDKKTVLKIAGRLQTYKDSIIFAVTNQSFLLKKMDRIIYLQEDGYDIGTFEEMAGKYDFQGFDEVKE